VDGGQSVTGTVAEAAQNFPQAIETAQVTVGTSPSMAC
jgi:hypothetical protein